MYAEKIFELKFLPRPGTYMLKPVLKTFDAMIYLKLSNIITIESVPRGREDYALLDYHGVVDAVYDSIKVLKSISYNKTVDVEERYYAHNYKNDYEKIEVEIDIGRRLRKLEWTFDSFFESYLIAVEELKKLVDNDLWRFGNAYLLSIKTDEKIPDGIISSVPSYLDGISRFDVVVYDNIVRARVVGPPVNSLCLLSELREVGVERLLKVYFREPERIWIRRKYKKYLNRIIPLVEEYIDNLDPRCDVKAFSRKKLVKINVYPYEEFYDVRKYFDEILRKKCFYVGECKL